MIAQDAAVSGYGLGVPRNPQGMSDAQAIRPAFQVGQTWLLRNGDEVRIEEIRSAHEFPILARSLAGPMYFHADGICCTSQFGHPSPYDLHALISGPPEQAQEGGAEPIDAESIPTTRKVPKDWFTDRLPTEADGDSDGEVVVLARFNESDDTVEALVDWSRVKPGTTWRHTFFWRPAEPAPEPEPEVAAPEPAPEPPAETEPTTQTRKVPRLFIEPVRRTHFPSGAIVVDAIADDGTCWVRVEGRDFSRNWLGEDVATGWQQIPCLPDREEPIDAA